MIQVILTVIPLTVAAAGTDPIPTDPVPSHRMCPEYVLSWGERGVGPGKFQAPRVVALAPDGDVLVLDTRSYRVQRFSANGSFEREWHASRPSDVDPPHGLAVGDDGRIYVSHVGRIDVFDPEGRLSRVIEIEGNVGAISVSDSQGIAVLIGTHEVCRLAPDGAVRARWGGDGDGPGQFRWASDLAIGAGEVVYVLDRSEARVQCFSPDGELLRAWGGRDYAAVHLQQLAAIACHPDGRVFVVDSPSKRVLVFDALGELLCTWGEGGRTPGTFDRPVSITVGPLGVYVCDEARARIQLFREPESRIRPVIWPAARRWLNAEDVTDPEVSRTPPPGQASPRPRKDR